LIPIVMKGEGYPIELALACIVIYCFPINSKI
jgi:hypothetical protein